MHNLGITKYIRGGYNAFSRTVLFDYRTSLLFYRLAGKSIRDHEKRLKRWLLRTIGRSVPACEGRKRVPKCSSLSKMVFRGEKPTSPLHNIKSYKSYVVVNVIFR